MVQLDPTDTGSGSGHAAPWERLFDELPEAERRLRLEQLRAQAPDGADLADRVQRLLAADSDTTPAGYPRRGRTYILWLEVNDVLGGSTLIARDLKRRPARGDAQG
jgi:hypothetical protein